MTVPIQNLRSGTLDKRPDPANLANGQIAINYNEGDPAIYFKGDSGALIKVSPTYVGSTAPNASPATGGSSGNSTGETWFDTTTDTLKIYNGTQFVDVSGGGGATGGGNDAVVLEYDQTVTTSYAISANKNAMTLGPLTIANGVTLEIPATSKLVILS